MDGERVWMQPVPSDQEPELDRYIERAARVDPDLWVVEVDDAEGRHFLTEPVEKGLNRGPPRLTAFVNGA